MSRKKKKAADAAALAAKQNQQAISTAISNGGKVVASPAQITPLANPPAPPPVDPNIHTANPHFGKHASPPQQTLLALPAPTEKEEREYAPAPKPVSAEKKKELDEKRMRYRGHRKNLVKEFGKDIKYFYVRQPVFKQETKTVPLLDSDNKPILDDAGDPKMTEALVFNDDESIKLVEDKTKRGHPIGVIAAFNQHQVSWSQCHITMDKWDKRKGRNDARARALFADDLQGCILSASEKIWERCSMDFDRKSGNYIMRMPSPEYRDRFAREILRIRDVMKVVDQKRLENLEVQKALDSGAKEPPKTFNEDQIKTFTSHLAKRAKTLADAATK